MKIRSPDWLNKLGSVFEDAADDIEDVAFELRDSFAVEAIRAGIVIALTGVSRNALLSQADSSWVCPAESKWV